MAVETETLSGDWGRDIFQLTVDADGHRVVNVPWNKTAGSRAALDRAPERLAGLADPVVTQDDVQAVHHQILDQILEFAHHDTFYLVQAGLQLRRTGRHKEALELFERAHALEPTDTTRLNIQKLKQELSGPSQP